MTTAQLKNILQSNVLSVCPLIEEMLLNAAMHIEAGAHILLAPPCGCCDEAEEELLKQIFACASDKAFVAGQIQSPKESLQESGGSLSYETYYASVLKQAKFLEQSGVSFIFLTDFTDVQLAKCAFYALREATALPVCAGFSVRNDEKGLKQAMSLLVTLQSLGASAVGITGEDIEETLELLSELQGFATVPLFTLCCASGYLEPEEYGDYVSSFVNQKCALLGLYQKGPAFTAAATKALWQLSPLAPDFPLLHAVASKTETIFLDFNGNIVGKNRQLVEIKTEEMQEIVQALSLFNRVVLHRYALLLRIWMYCAMPSCIMPVGRRCALMNMAKF